MRFYRWDSELEPGVSHEIVRALALWELAPHSGHPAVDELEALILADDYLGIINYEVRYAELPWFILASLRQALAFYQKRQDIQIPGVNPRETAIRKFRESEILCRETNNILRCRRTGSLSFRPCVEAVLSHAARKISSILGPDVPPLEELQMQFGPGATTSVPKRMASPRAKLGSPLACSEELFPIAQTVLREAPAWRSVYASEGETPSVEIHDGTVQFVPKSAKEHRAIVVEPILNTFVQAGVGRWIARKLRRSGVDIRDQSVNRRLARKGSLDGTLATIDLSSASDTIATELIYELLPIDFATWLARFRTGHVSFEDNRITLEKFSSMGNGFTFPLETLIFYAIAYGSCVESGSDKRLVNAYGDDIIVPTEAVPLLFETLAACGFKVNDQKSYSSGLFRESCGADYFLGIDIRPCYLKGETSPSGNEPCLHVYDLFRLHNHYYRQFNGAVCRFIRSYLDESIQLFGPDGYGDGHLISESWPRRRSKRMLADGYAGYVFDTFSWKSRKSFKPSRGDRSLPTYSTYVGASLATSVVRDYRGDDFSVTVPGVWSVNRISVYTFNT